MSVVMFSEHIVVLGFEVLTAVNTVFWVVTLCSSERIRRFGGNIASILKAGGK
jgi:hypothetical protein